jgi:hypothetical protein
VAIDAPRLVEMALYVWEIAVSYEEIRFGRI